MQVPQVPLTDQITEVRREITMRERIYPRWVETGRLTKAAAERQTDAMRAVMATLLAVASNRSLERTT